MLNSDYFSSDKSAAFETNYYESLYESIVDGNDIPSVPELVKIDKELDEKYFLLINNNSTNEITNIHQGENEDDNDNSYLDIDKIIIDEKLETLNSKIDFYLGKADDLNDEFKKECLLEILENLDNKKLITQKFIDEKLQYIYELFSEDSKDELINLCNFLRTGINNKEIPNNEELKNIIDKSLSNIDLFSGNSSYLEQINKINKICEKMWKNI